MAQLKVEQMVAVKGIAEGDMFIVEVGPPYQWLSWWDGEQMRVEPVYDSAEMKA